ncbi:MAG: FG-GAP repeat protein, partial [Rhizobiales bacterium]|nr:FG-GAP repeat protein [Hyphomicrobiales bacterium]
NNTPVYLGSEGNTGDFFTGQVKEIRFWNIARTPEEIQTNRFIRLASPSSQANLVGYYPMNSESSLLTDSSATKNNGQLGSATSQLSTGYQTLEVATGGDINGDGLDDLVIGNPYVSASTQNGGGGINSGEVFSIFGNDKLQDIPANTSFTLSELTPTSQVEQASQTDEVLNLNRSKSEVFLEDKNLYNTRHTCT